MKTIYVFALFVVVACIQIFVPAHMIIDSEDIISSGAVYRFKTRPVDPNDPFRGKYITLNFEMNSFKTSDTTYVRGRDVYVYLQNDDEGFAEAMKVSKTPLDIDADYVIAKVTYNYNEVVGFRLPFDRFYMEESKAYEAELAYRSASRNDVYTDVYALVHIKEDRAVLKDVFINEIPIKEYVENNTED